MVIAALVSFGMLLVAWIAAPAGQPDRESLTVAAEPATVLDTSPQHA